MKVTTTIVIVAIGLMAVESSARDQRGQKPERKGPPSMQRGDHGPIFGPDQRGGRPSFQGRNSSRGPQMNQGQHSRKGQPSSRGHQGFQGRGKGKQFSRGFQGPGRQSPGRFGPPQQRFTPPMDGGFRGGPPMMGGRPQGGPPGPGFRGPQSFRPSFKAQRQSSGHDSRQSVRGNQRGSDAGVGAQSQMQRGPQGPGFRGGPRPDLWTREPGNRGSQQSQRGLRGQQFREPGSNSSSRGPSQRPDGDRVGPDSRKEDGGSAPKDMNRSNSGFRGSPPWSNQGSEFRGPPSDRRPSGGPGPDGFRGPPDSQRGGPPWRRPDQSKSQASNEHRRPSLDRDGAPAKEMKRPDAAPSREQNRSAAKPTDRVPNAREGQGRDTKPDVRKPELRREGPPKKDGDVRRESPRDGDAKSGVRRQNPREGESTSGRRPPPREGDRDSSRRETPRDGAGDRE